MHKLMQIFRCARAEYVHWLTDSRMAIVFVLLLFNDTLAVRPLLERAGEMQERITWLEPFIAVGNSGTILLILPIVFFILISDFPRAHGNALFYIHRIGRENWLVAQLIALAMMILTYLLVVACGAVLPVIGQSNFDSDWSLVVTDYSRRFPEKAYSYELLPENLYHQMKDALTAAIYTYSLVALYLFLLGVLLLCGTLLQNRKVSNGIVGFLIASGAALCSIQSDIMWVFPMAQSITWLHFTKFYRKPVFPIWISYLYFSVLILVLIGTAFYAIRRFPFDTQQDE